MPAEVHGAQMNSYKKLSGGKLGRRKKKANEDDDNNDHLEASAV